MASLPSPAKPCQEKTLPSPLLNRSVTICPPTSARAGGSLYASTSAKSIGTKSASSSSAAISSLLPNALPPSSNSAPDLARKVLSRPRSRVACSEPHKKQQPHQSSFFTYN